MRKSAAAMDETTGRRALQAAFHTAQLHGLRRVKLKYAGGEATLHFRRIRRLHDHAATLAAKASIQLDEVLLTNGTLLRPEDAHWCADQGIRIMVSLDGVGALHDRLRPWPDGRGSFAQVRHAVDELLLPYGIHPHISMTVTGINACGAPDVARWAVVERKLPLNFNLYRSNALSATRAGLACEEAAIVKGLLAACAVIEADLPTEPILGGLLDRVQLFTHTHACGAGQNYAVISHDGRLAGCHMRLDETQPLNAEDDLLAVTCARHDPKSGGRRERRLPRLRFPLPMRRRLSPGDAIVPTGAGTCAVQTAPLFARCCRPCMRLEGLRLLKGARIPPLTALSSACQPAVRKREDSGVSPLLFCHLPSVGAGSPLIGRRQLFARATVRVAYLYGLCR